MTHEAGSIYEEHARLIKATKLADVIAGDRITSAMLEKVGDDVDFWHLAAQKAEVRPPSPKTIAHVRVLVRRREKFGTAEAVFAHLERSYEQDRQRFIEGIAE